MSHPLGTNCLPGEPAGENKKQPIIIDCSNIVEINVAFMSAVCWLVELKWPSMHKNEEEMTQCSQFK